MAVPVIVVKTGKLQYPMFKYAPHAFLYFVVDLIY